jgi:hypothetical protein
MTFREEREGQAERQREIGDWRRSEKQSREVVGGVRVMCKSKDMAKKRAAGRQDAGTRSVVAELDRQLASVDGKLREYEDLLGERERLRAARATLLGEASAGQITQDDVASYLEQHPGSQPKEIAQALGVTANRVSAHLFRGKSTRFVSRAGGWSVRR